MITHPDLVARLVKPGIKIKEEVTPREFQNLHLLLNSCVAIAKILDLYKKQVIYRKEISPTEMDMLIGDAAVMMGAFEASFLTLKPVQADAERLKKDITPNQCHLLHMALGVFGEAGELLEIILKHIFYGEEINQEELVKELGDGEFYNEAIRQIFNLLREHILNKNIEKLCTGKNARYKDGNYSDEAAQQRADATPEFVHTPHQANQNTGNDFSEHPFTDNETMAP